MEETATQGASSAASQGVSSTATQVVQTARAEADAYRSGEDRPLRGYLAVMGVFAAVVAAAAGLAAATRKQLPRQISPWDVVLLSFGTHKLSRTLSKDAVTSPLRAPFTRYDSNGGPAEVLEEVRHPSGWRHTLGELLACPFCLDMWIATGFAIGLVFAPRLTRLIATTFTALAGADFLHLGYAAAQQAQSG